MGDTPRTGEQPPPPALSVIVASKGRPTLKDTLTSASEQMIPGDELLLEVNQDAPWGHRARQRLMERARGDALLFIDDDDTYVAGALEAIRAGVAERPERVHIFRMRYADGDREALWREPEAKLGNVSTGMIVAPNRPDLLGSWESDDYTADYAFLVQTLEKAGEPVWHEEVVVSAGYARDVTR